DAQHLVLDQFLSALAGRSLGGGVRDTVNGRIGCAPANGCQAAQLIKGGHKDGETQANQHGR
ncbi:MAG TPA: hypothetical protein PLS93_16990, partial [Accumulibacter sp.]|nr:hypothetical protein [Accumulibacter sp.]